MSMLECAADVWKRSMTNVDLAAPIVLDDLVGGMVRAAANDPSLVSDLVLFLWYCQLIPITSNTLTICSSNTYN